jgi:hypothetical protein
MVETHCEQASKALTFPKYIYIYIYMPQKSCVIGKIFGTWETHWEIIGK